VKQPAGFKQAIKAFVTEHGIALEVRTLRPVVLHDRFLIHDGGMLIFGTSFNGLGLKQSFVRRARGGHPRVGRLDIRRGLAPRYASLGHGREAALRQKLRRRPSSH
jgi:hypothetical protein